MVDSKHYNNALPEEYMLDNFRIINVLGVGGFGIAYLAEDTYLEVKYVIKEYMPNEFAFRDQSSGEVHSVSPSSDDNYAWGLNEFLNEAKTIQKCKHHNVVEVVRFFKANNTAYFVMPYFKGNSLSQLLKLAPDEIATEQEIKDIVIPLLDGLKVLHSQNIFHRDIKPSNIYICNKNNTPILIDFGAARFSLGAHSRSITAIVTPCYSPHEQYHQHGRQGAWTDIYSMGAVMYRLISGKMPIESPARVGDDPLIPAVEIGKGRYSSALLTAIDHALAFNVNDRPQSIKQWLLEINGISTPEVKSVLKSKPDPIPLIPSVSKQNVNSTIPTLAWIIIIALVAGIAVLGVTVFQSDKTDELKAKIEREAIEAKTRQKALEIQIQKEALAAKMRQDNLEEKLKQDALKAKVTQDELKAKIQRDALVAKALQDELKAKIQNEAVQVQENTLEAQTYIERGKIYSKNKEFEQAIDQYNKALEISPRNIQALRYKGYSLYRLGFYEKAINTLKKSEKIEPNYFYNILNLIKAYCSSGQYENAKSISRQHRDILLINKEVFLKERELKKACGKEAVSSYLK